MPKVLSDKMSSDATCLPYRDRIRHGQFPRSIRQLPLLGWHSSRVAFSGSDHDAIENGLNEALRL
jgi:hypothetical protein